MQLRESLSAILVSLSAAAIALAIALFPQYRIIVGHWPQPVYEEITKQGTLLLVDRGSSHNDAVMRSQPLLAARVHLHDQPPRLGYVVGIRSASGKELRPPEGMEWVPPSADCSLALATADGSTQMLPCDQISDIVRPNAMDTRSRLRLSALRAWTGRMQGPS